MSLSRRSTKNFISAALVALIAFVGWAYQSDRLRPAAWGAPVATSGDAIFGTAVVKAAAEGDFVPLLSKTPDRLGAPFTAEWNSWPITEELLGSAAGTAARIVGVFPGLDLVMALGHVLAGLAFFFTARQFGRPRNWASVFAILFGLSNYIFARGLHHLGVGFCWHVPLCWLVISYAHSRGGIGKNRRRVIIAVLVSLATGALNPYFTFVYIQFLLLAAVARWLRSRRVAPALPALGLCAVAMAVFVAMQVDTLTYQASGLTEGSSVRRGYTDMELYPLKPLDLIFPLNWPLPWVQERLSVYQQQRVVPGEHPLNYMGLIAVCGAFLLGAACFKHLVAQRRFSSTFHNYGLPAVWIVAIGMLGGVMSSVALFTSIYLFRATNRFSIYLILLFYLYLTQIFASSSRRLPKPLGVGLLVLVLAVGLLDLPPRRLVASTAQTEREWQAIEKFVAAIEEKTGPNAQIFVLPVTDFPEVAPRLNEEHYAPLQLYVADSTLRFSYGNIKGHFRDTWQHSAEKLSGAALAERLSTYGFGGIVLFRKAYQDAGAEILEGLKAGGHATTVLTNRLAFVRLIPASKPILPPTAGIALGIGWLPLEYEANGSPILVSPGKSELKLSAESPETKKAFLNATFESAVARELRLRCNGAPVLQFNLRPNIPYRVESLELTLSLEVNALTVESVITSPAPISPEGRPSALVLRNFSVDGLTRTNDLKPEEARWDIAADDLKAIDVSAAATKHLLQIRGVGGHLWREFRSDGLAARLCGTAGQPVRRLELFPAQKSFSIACAVTPLAAIQIPHTAIFSCHTSDYAGLSFESLGDTGENRFQLGLGDRARWIPIGAPVSLQPNETYLVQLDVAENAVSVRVLGPGVDFTARHPLDATTSLAGKVWLWGDWVYGERQFAGRIQLLYLRETPADPSEFAELMRTHGNAATQCLAETNHP